jgi:hypothetical protein
MEGLTYSAQLPNIFQVVQLKILPLRPDHWQFPGPAPFSAVLALLSKRQKKVKDVFNSIFHSSGGSIYTF